VKLANHPEWLGVAISCDNDDGSMTRNLVKEEIFHILKPCAYSQIFYSPNKSKIQACNADMDNIAYPWDIVVLVSDDMIPQIKGYDDIIRNHMFSRFPDTNGILWFNDGHQGDKLNTLCVFGRRMYESFGYIYHPSYKSLFCDTELTDLCKTSLASKTLYVPYCIIRHEHPGTGYAQHMDELYQVNQKYWNEDMFTYIDRKTYEFDWSVLIPTMPGREQGLQRLVSSLYEKVGRLAPKLRMEICLEFDNRESSIGMKRQRLLEKARGKYLSFVDDDDEITDAYIEDLWACIQGKYHTMRLRGQMSQYTFVHSVDVKLTDMMATQDEPAIFQRPPNHLNPMLSDVAKLIRFKDAVHGEDLDWTINLYKHKFLSREYQSDPARIHYVYNLGQRSVHPDTVSLQRTTSYETMLQMIFTPSGEVQRPIQVAPKQTGLKLGTRGFVYSK
jgi:hypothetical protein